MSFTFILPVVHPDGDKINNYSHVEIALKKTLESLNHQTCSDTKTVVVCCQIPSWANEFDNNVLFLDVSNSEIFQPNRNDVKVDKGLKYILGILYAAEKFKSSLYMLADGDDYVDIRLAEDSFKALKGRLKDKKIDGYIIDKGLQVAVDINPKDDINYNNAYLVSDFHLTCGTCRIFKADSLKQKIIEINPDLFEKSKAWISSNPENIVSVPSEFSIWLDDLCKNDYLEKWHIVNVLGRHMRQEHHFNFLPFPKVGAAKACGHGNHDGPRQGGLHEKKIIGKLPMGIFKRSFGIQNKGIYDFSCLTNLIFKIRLRLS